MQRIHKNWITQFLICLLIVFITRLPYLLGDHLYFDGDEAILGIMAGDLLNGTNLPVYFYGQQYGFSFFEVVAVGIGLIFFGNTVWALKFGGLLIFSVGISFLFRLCIKKNLSFFISCGIILVICCFPAWLLWSTKPRGGYLTAFSVSCILIYIFQTVSPSLRSIALSSTLLAIGIHAQLMIAFPAAVCYTWWILREKKMNTLLMAVLFFAAGIVVFKLPAFMNEGYWRVPLSFRPQLSNLQSTLRSFPALFNGSYFYELIFVPGRKLALLSGCYAFIGLVTGVLALRRKNDSRYYILCLLAGGTISFLMISLMVGGVYRYSLGVLTAFLLIVFLSLIEMVKQKRKGFPVFIVSLICTGLGCCYLIKNIPAFWLHPAKNDMQLYNQFTDELKRRNCQHVFSLDPMLQWNLNYSGFSSRCTSKKERISRYAERVDQCYIDPGCKTALVGFYGFFNYTDSLNDWNDEIVIVNERFFIYEEPEDRHLKAGGFE